MLRSVTIWHEVAGSGPAVMMLHAGICDSGMWGCVFLGASVGGLVALDLAIARPDLISSRGAAVRLLLLHRQ